MTPALSAENTVRRRKRIHNPKRLMLFLLALGLTGLIIGPGFLIASVIQHNSDFLTYGLVYLLAGGGFLMIRIIIRGLHKHKQRKYSKHRR